MRASGAALCPLVAARVRSTAAQTCIAHFHLHGRCLRPGRLRLAAFKSLPCREFASSSDPPRIITHLSDIPNPKELNKYNWVSDPHGYLEAVDKRLINATIAEMYSKYGVEVAVVMLDGCALAMRPFVKSLFNHWGIGCQKSCNGLLLVVIMGKCRLEIVSGDGLDATALDKITLEEICDEYVMPEINAGRIPAGLRICLQQISMKLDEWPEKAFAADWVKEGGLHSSDKFSGGRSSVLVGDPRWLAPERAMTIILGAFAIAGTLLYAEDLYYEREQKRCPECGEWRLERHTETVTTMTCDPWQDGSVCEHTICQACGYHGKRTTIVPAAHNYTTTCTRLREPSYDAEGIEQITITCRNCGATETSEHIIPILVKRKQHAGI